MSDTRREVDYYKEIALGLKDLFISNMPDSLHVSVYPLIGEIKAALQNLILNEKVDERLIKPIIQGIDTLSLDVSFLLVNNKTKKYEIVILEIKRTSAVGLTELSQLIGYCLVSKAKFGILVNVDNTVSSRFSTILERDFDLTIIERTLKNDQDIVHKFGVMKWNSKTLAFEYTNAGSIKSIPELVEMVTQSLK